MRRALAALALFIGLVGLVGLAGCRRFGREHPEATHDSDRIEHRGAAYDRDREGLRAAAPPGSHRRANGRLIAGASTTRDKGLWTW